MCEIIIFEWSESIHSIHDWYTAMIEIDWFQNENILHSIIIIHWIVFDLNFLSTTVVNNLYISIKLLIRKTLDDFFCPIFVSKPACAYYTPHLPEGTQMQRKRYRGCNKVIQRDLLGCGKTDWTHRRGSRVDFVGYRPAGEKGSICGIFLLRINKRLGRHEAKLQPQTEFQIPASE